jgi:hypothetical protein
VSSADGRVCPVRMAEDEDRDGRVLRQRRPRMPTEKVTDGPKRSSGGMEHSSFMTGVNGRGPRATAEVRESIEPNYCWVVWFISLNVGKCEHVC